MDCASTRRCGDALRAAASSARAARCAPPARPARRRSARRRSAVPRRPEPPARRRRSPRPAPRRRLLVEEIHDIRLRQPAVAAGRRDRARDRAGSPRPAAAPTGSSLPAVAAGARPCGGRGCRRLAADAAGARLRPRAPSSMTASTCPLVTVGAARHLDLAHHAVGRRRHFQHDLVGLQVREILVALDRRRRAACARRRASRRPPIRAAAGPGFRSS